MNNGLVERLPAPGQNQKGWPWLEESSPALYSFRNDWPKISIVVPSYNQGIFLEETLRSILLQNYPSLELIVIDGGSKDESIEILKKYEPWITYWVSEKDKGQSDAINKGFRIANGDIVTWLCSDDLFTKGALHRVAEIFYDQPANIGLIYGNALLFGKGMETREGYLYEKADIERFIAGQAFAQPSAFFKHQYLKKVGAWVREDLHLGMDYDLFARLACVCRFHEVKEFFSLYRLHDASKTVSQHARLIEDWTRTFGNLCRNLGWNDVLEKMRSVPQLSAFLDYQYPLSFQPDPAILSAADRQLALFYHLCYWLKSCYHYNRHKDAKEILAILKREYPYDWLKKEKFISEIMTRSKIPEQVLKLLSNIRKGYKDLLVRK